ncbi:MAG: 4-hydroxythreonine-4-phosphate dehydrogenase PdxA [Emcibacter sp.]|nr:4-hydroxythreonine-4-phosphate dehydrogenase PdxA [Emcibacter sp.]
MPLSTINKPLPLAVSLGEPSGIGPEVILKSWAARSAQGLPDFFAIGNAEILRKTARKLSVDIPVHNIESASETNAVFERALPVLDIQGNADFEFGKPSTDTASLVLNSIEKAVDLIHKGEAAGLVTAPIQKSVLYSAGFTCPGHTEYLAELCTREGSPPEIPVMMLVSSELRVIPLTIHMALCDVATSITAELITETCLKIHRSLVQDFGIETPRIAVAGLNPHAGEEGTMGQEEQLIIAPALDHLRDQGMIIYGPLSADTMFHKTARTTYDAALCMYHDQALIPIKTLDFDGGVNVTVGLPIVRTSPDHGTALNIAGKNLASPNSMINALKLAQQIYKNRQEWTKKNV